MTRDQAMPYVSFAVDDALAQRDPRDAPANARLVGWQCGFEPLFVAVWSYLPDTRVNAFDAEELATDLLTERGWFGEEGPRPADFIL